MQANLGAIYNETLTVVNRLDARDSADKQDEYHATVLTGCMWSATATHTVQSDGTVVVGTVHRVQIPEQANFLPYRAWSGLDDKSDYFTLRQGDYVVRGVISETLDPATAKKTLASYEPDVFQIQHFRDLSKREGFIHSNEGVLRFAECYYLEG